MVTHIGIVYSSMLSILVHVMYRFATYGIWDTLDIQCCQSNRQVNKFKKLPEDSSYTVTTDPIYSLTPILISLGVLYTLRPDVSHTPPVTHLSPAVAGGFVMSLVQ